MKNYEISNFTSRLARLHKDTRAELGSREEIIYETYAKTINIEALTMINMASKKYTQSP